MPKPNKNESEADFIKRFMGSKEAIRDYPDEKQRFAVAKSFWKNKAKESAILMEYSVPISFKEKIEENINDFIINGIAINETTTLNNHKFIAEELQKAAPSLIGKKLLVDHDQRVANIKGIVLDAQWNATDKRIDFEAKVTDPTIKQMIKDRVLDSVSVGAYAKELVEDKDGSFIAKGIHFGELSFTPCPADERANFLQAITQAISFSK